MKKFGIVFLSLVLGLGLFGCSNNNSGDTSEKGEDSETVFKEYPKKESVDVNKIINKDYAQVVEPYLDLSKGDGLFVFTASSNKFIAKIDSKKLSSIDMVYFKTNETATIYSTAEDYTPNADSEAFKQFIEFLNTNSLNYGDFCTWVTYRFNLDAKTGVSTLKYDNKVKSQDEMHNILKNKGYSINNATDSTGISIEKASETVYVEGKHYDTTKNGEKPFVTLVIKDSVLSKLYPQLAYYVEYNSEYNYLRASICYGSNIQVLDITSNAKNIAGDFIKDDKRVILDKDMKIIKEFHSNIEKWLKKTGISMLDLSYFGMEYYGAFKK